MDIHSPLRIIYFPPNLVGPEYIRYHSLARRMRAAKGSRTRSPRRDPIWSRRPGRRGGDTGLTYHWSYYTRTASTASTSRSAWGRRYPDPEEIEKEYRTNVREPLLYFLEASAALPLPRKGSAVYRGRGGRPHRARRPRLLETRYHGAV